MKKGLSLTELAAEIERREHSKRDFLASTSAMDVAVGDKGVELVLPETGAYALNAVAEDQVASHTGIPAKYFDRMRAEAPELLATNIKAWFDKYPTSRMVRTLDGGTRAFLSNGYRPLENIDLCEAILPVLLDMNLHIMSCEVTERRLYIKAVDERILRDVPKGRKLGDGSHVFYDTCAPAIIVSNSEVGLGMLSVDSGVYTRQCTNMASIADGGMKRRHLGARNSLTDGEEIQHLLTDDTKKATDRAVWMQVRDVVKAAFDEARFDATIKKIAATAEQPIKGDPVKVVEMTAKRFGLSQDIGTSILRHLIEGADLSRYGLHAAVTRSAEDVASYDLASDMERIGGKIIELPKSEWQSLAEAA
jgi:hypothetical protein